LRSFSSMPMPFFGRALVHPVHNKIQRTGLTFQPLGRIGVPAKACRPSHHARNRRQRIPVKRSSRRAKIARPVRVRPADPRDEHFRRLPVSLNASKDGIYFTSRRKSYYKGCAFRDFSLQFTTRSDELRICWRKSCAWRNCLIARFGVAVHLKLSMNYKWQLGSRIVRGRLTVSILTLRPIASVACTRSELRGS